MRYVIQTPEGQYQIINIEIMRTTKYNLGQIVVVFEIMTYTINIGQDVLCRLCLHILVLCQEKQNAIFFILIIASS